MPASHQLWDVPVAMRDGVDLSADVYLPGDRTGGYPTVVSRTPYSKQHPVLVQGARYLAARGYAAVLQDVRGRHDSDGEWVPFRNEGPDGYDTVEWAASQPWSNGRVGTMGGSYGAWYQWALVREKPPHLVTMVSTAPGGNWMREIPFHNGVVMLVMLGWLNLVGGRVLQDPNQVDDWGAVFRHLPLRSMDEQIGRVIPTWREWLDHPCLDDYWKQVRLDDDFAHIDVPTLHITGWFDGDQPGALYFHEGMCAASSRANDQYLVIGPWDHSGTRVPRRELGGVDFGDHAIADILDLHRRWFDRWLQDSPESPLPARARVFLTGANTWRDATEWPPAGTLVDWHLHSRGAANTLAGDGLLSPLPAGDDQPDDVFTYDPADPVPSALDENFYAATAVETPLDHRFKHRRDDVLVYTSAPMTAPLTLVGVPHAVLNAATDGRDTDWFVALHDVDPLGRSMLLVEGRLRGRFHAGLEQEQLLEPGETTEFRINLTAIGHVVRTGHRLRFTVTSSDFPTWDRNPNTGHPIGADSELRVATNRLSHGPGRPSRITLPVAHAAALAAVAPGVGWPVTGTAVAPSTDVTVL